MSQIQDTGVTNTRVTDISVTETGVTDTYINQLDTVIQISVKCMNAFADTIAAQKFRFETGED